MQQPRVFTWVYNLNHLETFHNRKPTKPTDTSNAKQDRNDANKWIIPPIGTQNFGHNQLTVNSTTQKKKEKKKKDIF